MSGTLANCSRLERLSGASRDAALPLPAARAVGASPTNGERGNIGPVGSL